MGQQLSIDFSRSEIHPGNIGNASSQCELLLKHLQKGKTITGLEALVMFGIGHLPRRILDLKEKGYLILDEYVVVTKANGKDAHVKRYYMQNMQIN